MRLDISQDTKVYAWDYLKNNSLGHRSKANGNKLEQFVGLVGEITVKNFLGINHVESDGFDGGYDLTLKGKKIDIKTMGRNVDVKPHYVNNFITYQKDYDCDIYIFASINKKTSVLTICGYATKDDLISKGNRYEQGEIRVRDDGTEFKFKAPTIEIENNKLKSIKQLL